MRVPRICLLLLPVSAAAQTAGRLVTIGGELAVGAELGTIRDVALPPGRIVILDRSAPHLRVLDAAGRLRQTVGRSGSGPGEYAVPFAVSFDSTTNALYVVDPANARLTQYTVADTLLLVRTIPTSVVNLRDVCVSRARIFGTSSSRTQLLDELEVRQGQLVSRGTLGKPATNHPLATHPLLIGRSSDGPLHCDDSGNVWVASRVLGELHRVSIEAGEQVTIPMPGFHPIQLRAEGGGGLSFSVPADGFYEEVSSLLATDSGVRVVLSRHNRDGSVTGYQFLDFGRDGKSQGARIPAQWRQIGQSAAGAVCVVNDPFPTLTVYEGSRCP